MTRALVLFRGSLWNEILTQNWQPGGTAESQLKGVKENRVTALSGTHEKRIDAEHRCQIVNSYSSYGDFNET